MRRPAALPKAVVASLVLALCGVAVTPAQAASLPSAGPVRSSAQVAGALATTVLARDTSADVTRTLRDSQTVRLFSVRFTTTTPDTTHRVRARVVATVPLRTTEPTMLSSGTILCWGPDEERPTSAFDWEHALNNQMNVFRGETGTISPRWTYVARTPGTHTCWLSWYTSHHSYSGDPGSEQTIHADSGSYLEVTSPLPDSADHVRIASKGADVVRSSAPSVNVLSRTWRAPEGVSRLAVNGDVMLTSCTSTTDRVCEERDYDKVHGSRARTTLVVGQYAVGGGYCAVSTLPTTRPVSRMRHHLSTYSALTVPVSTAAGCTRTFRVYLNVRWLEHGGMKVHHYTAVSAIVPAA